MAHIIMSSKNQPRFSQMVYWLGPNNWPKSFKKYRIFLKSFEPLLHNEGESMAHEIVSSLRQQWGSTD